MLAMRLLKRFQALDSVNKLMSVWKKNKMVFDVNLFEYKLSLILNNR